MATKVPLVMHEDNDETVDITLTGAVGEDLTDVTGLEMVLKATGCDDDDVVLSSAVPSQILITLQTATTIVAEAYVPAAALADPYPRVWRLDALTGVLRRTAVYGPVTVVDL